MKLYRLNDYFQPYQTFDDDYGAFNDRWHIKHLIGEVRVSTVFLAVDHNFSGIGPPILFETFVFGGEHDEYMRRYATYEEAVRGHEEVIRMVLDSQNVLMPREPEQKEDEHRIKTSKRNINL